MYNFNLEKNEELFGVFDDVLVRQNDKQKIISVALTNKRVLFLDFVNEEPNETLRVTRATNYIRQKEVFYFLNLDEIKSVSEDELFQIITKDNKVIEFDNKDLFKQLKSGE